MTPTPEMTSSDLLALLRLLDDSSIEVWLDGGWGVDALLHEQTRLHKDVDIIVRLSDVSDLRNLLQRIGFALKEGSPPNSFVLADGLGLEVDVHAVVFDDAAYGVYRMENGEDWIYPVEGFDGVGLVDGIEVQCLTPAAQVLCHTHGYKPIEKDFQDMEHLRARFAVEIPPQLEGSEA
ncbi:MAG: amino acid transporter [Chloroflexi bacterium]|nr:amino acid transporter [Chloroflexota bacterium]